jgi:hypothetical protein
MVGAKTENAMVSPSCDIKKFIEAVREKDYLDIIYLADREALDVWRYSKRAKVRTQVHQKEMADYEMRLKEFVTFMRSSLIRRQDKNPDFQLFNSVREDVFRSVALHS